MSRNYPGNIMTRINFRHALVALASMAAFATFTFAQAPAASINSPIRPKQGQWENLKYIKTEPTSLTKFGSAFPVGNGHLGAKIFGGVAAETIALNDATLWSGEPEHYESPDAKVAFDATRAALAAGDYKTAYAAAKGMEGHDNESYLPLANLYLNFPGHDSYTGYSNTLDINTAVVTTRYTVNGTTFTREIFASYPAQVIVVRLSSDRHAALNFSVSMDTQLHNGSTDVTPNEIHVTGRAPYHVDNYYRQHTILWDPHKGMLMDTRLHVAIAGGTIKQGDKDIAVTGADTATLIFSAATSFNGFDRDPATEGRDPQPIAKKYLEAAAAQPYKNLLAAHIADYQSLFHRLYVEVNGEKPNKYALEYQSARYLLIVCSRLNSGAMRNEQGIWNNQLTPIWASNFTLNENPEKYYSVAEAANLPETTTPLIHFMSDLAKSGAVTARVNYGAHGWVAHHNTDIWAMSTMATGDPVWAAWPMGGIWMCQNLWEHYAFGLDKAYLRKDAYPIMKGAAEFALDLLVTGKKGYLVTSPASSSENAFIDPNSGEHVSESQGSTMDMALIKQLFQNTIKASEILQTDPVFRARLQATLPRLLPFQIGSKGQLQEWSEDFKEFEPEHRHVSHLVAVWPLEQITPAQPELFAAARKSLELRGKGGHLPDKAAMWARLLDGDKTIATLQTNFPLQFDSPDSGFAEMLLQSHADVVNLLPALPSTWADGEILGIRARGGYEVDIIWKDHHLATAKIRSYAGKTPAIRIENKDAALTDPRIHFDMVR